MTAAEMKNESFTEVESEWQGPTKHAGAPEAPFTITLKLDQDFVSQIRYLQNRYGEPFEFMNGFHNENLNFSSFIDNFIDANTPAEVSIDANANSGTKDICTLTNDMTKPHMKLLCFNKIYYEQKKKWGKEQADQWLEDEWSGAGYIHDAASSSMKSYCFAYDLDKVAERGMYFINRFKTRPPQHLTTFDNHVLETISWLSNRTSGAVGLPSFLIYHWYFWNKDVQNGYYIKDPEYYRRQSLQAFVFNVNQPYLRITECAFTNISIMDTPYLTELFGGRQFPDGTFAIDHIPEILEHQKVFMEVVSQIRNDTMMTFPVLTYSLLYQNDKFVDEDFARWCNKMNLNWYDSNFYVGSDVTSLSNCCFDARQEMIIRTRGEHIYKGQFRDLYNTFSHRSDVEVWFEGSWRRAKLTCLKEVHPIFHVITEDGREMYATDDHIHLTADGEKKSHELKAGMCLQIETEQVDEKSTHKIQTSVSGQDFIKLVERVDQEGDYVFCCELEDTDHPYFTLANGIKTHNCRLISDTSKLDAFINSIGGTSLSIGSVKVNTINLRRIALESGGNEDYYLEILKKRVDTCVKTLWCVRHIIKRNIEKGLLPNYTSGLIEMEKQYNTIGITAMYETMADFGYIMTDEMGNKYYTDEGMMFAEKIMNVINTQKDEYREKWPEDFNYSHNVECIPELLGGDEAA